ncbi:MAG: anti sigma factor C-terminal domain-containing protein [Ruminococcus sp.]|nr:anti sigma factor C-terminal domain-containing protein [Ruminococcus sp.]
MTYKELLELYKSGELDKEQREKVEKEIEKQEAISEYLFEAEGIPEFSDMDIQTDSAFAESGDDKKFMKMINKSIRRAFIKLGVAVGVVVLAVVLITVTALPYIVDACYYNPAKVLGEYNGIETNQMSLDTAVYTELFTPGYYRTKVIVDREGYGNYDIRIMQNFSVNSQFRDVYGTVEKGNLNLYTDGLFKLPTSNAFVAGEIKNVIGHGGAGAAGSAENALEKLKELDDTDYYVGYITLDKVMTYDEFVAWCEAHGVNPEWCAVCCSQESGDYSAQDIIGFMYHSGASQMAYDDEKYPYLNYFDMIETVEDYSEDTISADVMETHMVSMLRYMAEREDFREMAGCVISEHYFEQLARDIEENGLSIYGFAVVAQRADLLEISQMENVYYIYTSPLI